MQEIQSQGYDWINQLGDLIAHGKLAEAGDTKNEGFALFTRLAGMTGFLIDQDRIDAQILLFEVADMLSKAAELNREAAELIGKPVMLPCPTVKRPQYLGDGVDPSGMSQLVIPAEDFAVGEMGFDDVTGMLSSAGLSTRFVNGWELASTLDLEGKRALGFLQKPTPAYTTDDRFQLLGRWPTGSREARVLQSLYVPVGMDYGPQDSSSSTRGQAAKIGIGLMSEVDPTGGGATPEGTSIRPIWRVASSNARPDVEGYFYHTNQPSNTGDYVLTGVPVPEGRWVPMGIDVLLNSAYNSSDGQLRIWIDGDLVVNETDVSFISQRAAGGPATPEVQVVTVSLWYGGGVTDNWTPNQEQTFYIAELYADQSRW